MQHGETTMNSNKPSPYQVAVNVKRKHSHRNFEDYWEIELIDRDSGVLRKTYVTLNMRNYVMWQHLLLAMEEYPGSAICIHGNFKCVKGKTDIINADVKFSHEKSFDRDEFMNAVADMYYA